MMTRSINRHLVAMGVEQIETTDSATWGEQRLKIHHSKNQRISVFDANITIVIQIEAVREFVG